MTIAVANVANTNTFDYWRNRTNELAYAMSNYAITAGGSSASASGNASLQGTFNANNLSTNNSLLISNGSTVNCSVNTTAFLMRSTTGNVFISTTYSSFANAVFVGSGTTNTVANTSAITFNNPTAPFTFGAPSASEISTGDYFLSSSGAWAKVQSSTFSGSANVTTSIKTVDTFDKTDFTAAEYIVYVSDQNANNKMAAKLLAFHDGTVGYVTEFATMISNTNIGSFNCTVNPTSFVLQFNSTVANASVKFIRNAV